MTAQHYFKTDREFDCVIVGGGIHGTHCCQRLLEDTDLDREGIAIVDPNERLLDSFRRAARACGMDSLRSTFVHHVGTDPFGLESFAEARDREDELHPTVDYPDRPSLDLFLDYADHVVGTKNLDALHLQTTAEAIHEQPGSHGLRVTTGQGTIDARACVLAIGHGGRVRTPDWAAGVDGVDHVWEGFDPEADSEETVIIGGGITAGQLACELSETETVTMVTRHPLQWAVSEADPPWLTWRRIERGLHCHPPASKRRLETIREARYAATVPPYLYDTLESRLDNGQVRIQQGDVDSATGREGSVGLSLDDGLQITADRVVCATGFEPVFDHPFVDRLVADLNLRRGYRNLPWLDDETLAWETVDEESLPLYVSGALALAAVGPYAPNVPGAKRSADRITNAITAVRSRPAQSVPNAD